MPNCMLVINETMCGGIPLHYCGKWSDNTSVCISINFHINSQVCTQGSKLIS
jgi:hypothetical protein